VVRDLLSLLNCTTTLQIRGDPRCPERVAAGRLRQSSLPGAPLDRTAAPGTPLAGVAGASVQTAQGFPEAYTTLLQERWCKSVRRLAVWPSGGRMDGACRARQAYYRAACLRADAGCPSAAAGVGQSQWFERAGQQSNKDQHFSLRNLWSSSTSSRISLGSCVRCHWHSRRPASIRSFSGAAERVALIV
jgi:hypothetical protein